MRRQPASASAVGLARTLGLAESTFAHSDPLSSAARRSMTSEEIAELMREQCRFVSAEDHEWENVHDGVHTKDEAVAALLKRHFNAGPLFVWIVPDHGAIVQRSDIPRYIARHVLTHSVYVADPEFRAFVYVHTNGVATAWRE